MASTEIWRTSRARKAGTRASTANGKSGRNRRAGLALWTLLNAQALLDGTAGAADSAAFIEDDRRRLAAR
jgi:hypothetical protein